ncbi:AAA-like domain protein [Novipirellula aureliae]|uniref:AAA-like domain protein n=1 Tax=Novipirellula aureliae TaxID=2527966 RepID=A0A5C6ECT8_9BACT|nr:ATP-binding protein [Novipirellula aureliae]TWU45541.1 AAA-like domain protein [Novipirellula aureliae]
MSAPSPEIFEKLSSFYLGRHFDLDSGEVQDDLLMYDSKDLCTHAMCVGMTGSGKTGLCISLLEEAAIDGIPAICVDPKGDLANLLLTFPELRPSDFEEWLHDDAARQKGLTKSELAERTAERWRSGLASWGQTPDRIERLKDSVDVAIYTPGSNIGLPMTVLKSFDAPPPESRDDSELIGDRVTGAVSGLLTLMGMDADPMISPEHILISSILTHRWREGKDVSLAQLIRFIQSPPIERIGVMDLNSFMPIAERGKLAMRLNNLLASPAFASWLEGESLSIPKLLHTPEGKPRLTILSIAHLNDSERMFFVTILLNELVAWMRMQMGTSSLRAMFYMDEVAGYFPPVSNPPSKPPMLTLLKQARAFGLGVTLATQNPVDLDYKGLSNIGTWFLGRLQTERDKARVLEGLEGAAGQAGQRFDRQKMEQILAGLGSRVFLMNNVHDDQPSIFQTRWAMSFLAGPLARTQISKLMQDRKRMMEASQQAIAPEEVIDKTETQPVAAEERPIVPAGIEERFVALNLTPAEGARLVYRPALYGEASMHFIRKTADLDDWEDIRLFVPCARGLPDDVWESSRPLRLSTEQLDSPEAGFTFASLPTELISKSRYRSFKSQLKDYLYRHHYRSLYKCNLVKGYAPSDEKSKAIAYFRHRIHEAKDEAERKLRDKYEDKMRSLDRKIKAAEQRVEVEQQQYETAKWSTISSVGASILGAFMGRKLASRTNVSKVSTAARGASRAAQQRSDIGRAEETLRQLAVEMTELDVELQEELAILGEQFDEQNLELEETKIAPRKSDLNVSDPLILWTPWQIDPAGIASKLFAEEA